MATPAATRNTSLIARDMAFSTAARGAAGKPCTTAGVACSVLALMLEGTAMVVR